MAAEPYVRCLGMAVEESETYLGECTLVDNRVNLTQFLEDSHPDLLSPPLTKACASGLRAL